MQAAIAKTTGHGQPELTRRRRFLRFVANVISHTRFGPLSKVEKRGRKKGSKKGVRVILEHQFSSPRFYPFCYSRFTLSVPRFPVIPALPCHSRASLSFPRKRESSKPIAEGAKPFFALQVKKINLTPFSCSLFPETIAEPRPQWTYRQCPGTRRTDAPISRHKYRFPRPVQHACRFQ